MSRTPDQEPTAATVTQEQLESDAPKNTLTGIAPKWFWVGCVLLVIFASLHSATCTIGGGDTWVAMSNGRYSSYPWCTNQDHRTWQMKLLDVFGVHITRVDYLGGKTRPYDPESSKLSSIFKRIGHIMGDDDQAALPDSIINEGWVNQNWLTHVVFFKMRQAWGENSIVIYKFLQAVLTGLLAFWIARIMRAHPILAASLAAFGMLLSRSFIDLRPNQSSILYAAALMLILAWWRNRPENYKRMLWLIPVMLIWSNVHGGFIYAIMVMGAVLIAHVVQNFTGRWAHAFVVLGLVVTGCMLLGGAKGLAPEHMPWKVFGSISGVVLLLLAIWALIRTAHIDQDCFYQVGIKGLITLVVGCAIVVLTPIIFSPFGLENLTHPLLVAAGEEGKIWRDVIEWRPIWDPRGFGNETPYVYFLIVFALVATTWGFVYFLRPKPDKTYPQVPWPKIDLAFIAVLVLTLAMSIKSRRFIFLGGIVLAPLVAVMLQQIIDMVGILRQKRRGALELTPPALPSRWAMPLAGSSLVAALTVGTIFAVGMWSIYYRPNLDGRRLTVFRRMVGIEAQPVRAIKFFDDNHVQGLVLNEWVNGGFIGFHQTPDKETGSPPCKVYMDGRSQAAYHLEHFQRWQLMKPSFPRPNAQAQQMLLQLGQRLDISPKDPEFYQKLFDASTRSKQLYNQILQLQNGDPKLLSVIMRAQLHAIGKKLDIDPDAPDFADQIAAKMCVTTNGFHQLARLSPGDPKVYDAIVRYDGINAVLLSQAKSPTIFDLLSQSGNWETVYINDKDVIMLCKSDPRNEELLRDPRTTLTYQDENARQMSLGYLLSQRREVNDRREGVQMLTTITPRFYNRLLYDAVWQSGLSLRMVDEVETYFQGQVEHFRTKLAEDGRFNRRNHLLCLQHALGSLAELSDKVRGDNTAMQKYRAEQKAYQEELMEVIEEMRGELLW